MPAINKTGIIRLGITGHQYLREMPALITATNEAIDIIKKRYLGTQIELYSALSKGADTLAAQVGLEYSIPLHVIIPFEEKKYLNDMSTEHRITYNEFITKATNQIHLRESRLVSVYQTIEKYLVEQMDCLIAYWNGQNTRGPGGTGDVVTQFNLTGKPWVWIRVDNMVQEAPVMLPKGLDQGSIELKNWNNF